VPQVSGNALDVRSDARLSHTSAMATIAVGDVHGNLLALNDLLGLLRAQITNEDTVVFLGDYIDRGPDTKGCIDAILEFQQEMAGEVVCLRGNHEDWFFDCVPRSHISFFEGLVPYYQGPDGICVHGGLDVDGARLEDQPLEILLGGADGFPEDYTGAATVAYGHWDNAELDEQRWPRPKIIGATIGLDTISHGVLTAVRLTDRRLFQSSRYRASSG
jgi:Calcineurin-like phosphoesterase